MNAFQVESNASIDAENRKDIANRQRDIANKFRAISNKVQIDGKQSEVKASRDVNDSIKKYNIDDIENGEEINDDKDEGGVSSSLF